MGLGYFEEFVITNDITLGVKSNPVNKPKKIGKRFLKGPIDWAWLSKAAKLPGKTLHVGIALQYISGLTKSNEIKMQGRVLEELDISRQTYNKVLKGLEGAHLVSVDRNPGQTHIVTILYA